MYADDNTRHPLASPILADLSGLPPTLIQAGEKEVFVDSIVSFSKKAEKADVQVTLEVYRGMPHVFQCFAPAIPVIANEAISSMGHFIKDCIGFDKTPSKSKIDYMNPSVNNNITLSIKSSKL